MFSLALLDVIILINDLALADTLPDGFWIGLFDESQDGIFYWINGKESKVLLEE